MSSSFKLILASSSPYRANQLSTLNIPFKVIKPSIDETPHDKELPADLVARLSEEKAKSALTAFQALPKTDQGTSPTFIIGSDQVSVLNKQIIGKPGTHAKAREQLANASGKAITFLTGLCLIDAQSEKVENYLETTEVIFRKLSDDQIERYLLLEKPYDCAGSFKSEQMGVCLIDEIRGRDPNALIGLPLMGLLDLLLKFGVPYP